MSAQAVRALAPQPPSWHAAPEAELAVISALLIDADACRRALPNLSAGYFTNDSLRIALSVMRRIHERGHLVDPVTLREELSARGSLEDFGGLEGIAELMDAVPTSANIDAHIAILRKAFALRKALEIATDERTADPIAALRQLVETLDNGAAANGQRADEAAEAWPLLRDLLERPELLAPPAEVITRTAWAGRATLLVGPDKAGKSTLAAHAAAALTRGGWWLGSRTTQGRVLVCAPDEALGDTVRRLSELNADVDRIRLLSIRPPDLLASMRALLTTWPAELVVVDSLSEWARIVRGTAPEDGDAAGWGSVVRPLVQVARDFGCALLLLHHPRRSDGQYRGSLEIAAAVDCYLELSKPKPGEDAAVRRITGRARWPVEDYAVALRDGRYELVGGPELSLDVRVLLHVETHPGTSTRAIREAVSGRASALDNAVRTLLDRGAIERRSDGKLYPATSVQSGLEGV